MEPKCVGMLDNDRSTVVGSKRKVASQNLAHLFRASSEKLSIQSNCDSKLGKRKRTNCHLHLRKSVLKNYLNFMRSRVPQRVLFYQNSEWTDFPQDIILIVKEDFRAKKAVFEVKVRDFHIMLDILHMVQVDLITGLQKPVAWIDEAGSCFFPESYRISSEMHGNFETQSKRTEEFMTTEPNRVTDINLQLDIDLNGLDSCNLEGVEESNIGYKRIKVNPLKDNQEFADDKKSDAKMEQVAENKQNQEAMSPDLVASLKLVDAESVKNMFIMGMNVIPNKDEIKITKYSSNYLRARLELFEKQVEIMQKYRGNANVRYAWLAASKDLISTIMNYGLAPGGPKNRPKFGVGVHLSALHCASKSAINCDADKNGVHYMVFTRVILGNVEPLHCGSEQWHPSDEKYDSGVDDLENPTHYVVWNMNLNTHIYPECVLSFRIPPVAKGPHFGNDSRIHGSGVSTCCRGPVDQVPTNTFQKDSGSHYHQVSMGKLALEKAARTPKSPWLPFSLLIDAISNVVTAKKMNDVTSNFELFESKKICRDEFVRQLRLIVGDTLLKSTITSLLCKVQSKPIELIQPKQEPQSAAFK
ncbi:inactive poly [ADP-ribose] polymerase RCD1-like isoform X1 [Solanum dulcamara]|uniref:inactive poly [ADP-ribose] polymerase RCD1-like isoform X1 n=1 Tax=Solanum dulcamara TaxID=45834 RepID=UPI0024858A01|nr:inactive poly [ADP-ribose] polymerase RCD1-like isoform X1 [Solanum dulcamara]XP_055829856.1 inactive poly [ADP-ribose] polymerase RCD1-like isoform X1 [Solanum dulcamara]XP_055829857.1 inactive poly [ADP-ribose] polymerase RCD1-like isoform X1 [Solanum dulcamara]